MNKTSYTKDTKKFWQAREQARSALDKKRANVSFAKKVEVAKKLRADAAFLKSGRIVTPKP